MGHNGDVIPAGYMAKRVSKKPDVLDVPEFVTDIFSLSSCISHDFDYYIPYWKHNGYWLFDSPEIIKKLAVENSLPLEGTTLFYYETDGREFDGETWQTYSPESFPTNVVETSLNKLAFNNSEPGPYRIFAVYSVSWTDTHP
jgi:hypothetical protein